MKMIAFLGRYGKQSISDVMKLRVSEAHRLMQAISEIMQEEKDAAKRIS